MFNYFGRYMKIELFSNKMKKKITIESSKIQFEVTIKKYLSNMKDEALVSIYNLDRDIYNRMIQDNELIYDKINIYAGYKNKGEEKVFLVFNQKILSVTIDRSNLTSPVTKIVCSPLYQRDFQSLKFSSGTSLYSVLSVLTKRMYLKKPYIDNKLKLRNLKSDLIINNINNGLSQLLRDYPFLSIYNDTDSVNDIMKFEIIEYKTNRTIEISPYNGTLIKNWVQVTSENLTFTSLLVHNYFIGDGLFIDRKWMDHSISQTSDYKEHLKSENRLKINDKSKETKDLYIITGLDYNLTLDGEFSVNITCKPKKFFNSHIRKGI